MYLIYLIYLIYLSASIQSVSVAAATVSMGGIMLRPCRTTRGIVA